MKISVAILTFNSESTIEKTLRSISFADEIVVVDSGSTDSTLHICAKYGAKIIHKPWAGYSQQKLYAINQCHNNWVLVLDSDEEASPELMIWLKSFREGPPDFYGYAFKRVMFIGETRWDVVWRNEYRVRFFRKDRFKILDNEPHERIIIDGPVKRLDLEIYHYSYKDFRDQVTKLNNHAYTWARSQPLKRNIGVIAVKLLMSPVARFIKLFILKQGFMKGIKGFIACRNEAFYVSLKYSYLYERIRQS